MSQHQHTPQPWEKEVIPNRIRFFGRLQATGIYLIAEVRTDHGGEMDRANADLLFAAPDLLEAADKVLAAWESGDLATAVRELSAAVEKAKGTP